MKKMIAATMLLLTVNFSNVAAYEKEDSSESTGIEMDKTNLFEDEIDLTHVVLYQIQLM